jgi:hypothetical protein
VKRLALIVCLTLATLAGTARATTYTVGTAGDPAGACAGTTGCSLRQLIAKINAAPFPPDRINVPAGSYTLALGPLVIGQSMSIVGAGANATTVAQPVPADRSNSGSRVFEIPGAGTVVTIQSLKMTGGTAHTGNGFFGGDVLNSGTLTLTDDWLTNGSAYSGGGIANRGGTLNVQRTLISGNRAPFGGGDSGGIQNYGNTTSGIVGHLVVDDSTITDNDARLVGGIFSWSEPGIAANTLTIRNSTIAGNRSQDEGGAFTDRGGGGLGVSQGTEVIENSIVANNLDINAGVTTHVNCGLIASGGITSLGHNLDSGTDCHFAGPGDVSNANPLLGPLAGNGGPTPTLALGAGSPALDKVPASGAGCSATDQRGIPRPQGAACDIGAFEQIVAPLNTGPPRIGGSAIQGQTLTESHGSWIYGATGFAYQWLRCTSAGASCAPIGGATNQFYPVAVADIGHRLRVQETATSPFAVSLPATSGPTGVVAARKLNVTANGSWLFYRHGLTQVVKLFLQKSVAKGTTVKLTCTSRKHAAKRNKCPFKRKTVHVRKTTRKLQLGKYFKKRLLAKGTRFDVQVTFPSTIGTVSRFTTRDRKNPRRQILCLPPGAKKPRKC